MVKKKTTNSESIPQRNIQNKRVALLLKALKADPTEDWTKDEVSLIIYWLLQISAFVIGTIFGLTGAKGIGVFISSLLCLIFIGLIYINYLDIPERILDPTEVVIENTASCLVTFILVWVTLYTLVHF
ncbi:uncharacterized protein CMU_036510 [Cryptosporidium muris RN66]|uniref:Rab5-interacting protein n=1 Tax=Cryptosporidium muris (strain RN66) TaxID=441375 RepID=B6AGY6_CRYMR|nr:uncharacterized protein CMU_036510 [Cryptosporidium muris RN66]EEA07477.1 hypothetical protein, conserved [Cryptosporidium muris RN66]|eukprot:XP_002141826.1 hypothetical protein [Cryptosporidium muris RN66]